MHYLIVFIADRMQNKYENNYFWPFSIRFSTKKLNFDETFLQKISISISLSLRD